MTLDNVAISKILKRLAQQTTTKEMKSLTLDNLKIKEKPFEWIRKEYRSLESALDVPLSNVEKIRYQVCEDYATNLITHATETLKSDIKDVLLEGIRNKQSKSEVSQALFDKLGQHNRNWKRIVETESVNTQNLASILDDVASTPKGKKIYFKRYEMADACDACKAIDGTIALWSESAKEDVDDPYASQVLWDGKECDIKRGIVGIGTMHPHCRGTWIKWDADFFDATEAIVNGKEQAWDEAVKATKTELGGDIDENSFKFRLKLQENYKKMNS